MSNYHLRKLTTRHHRRDTPYPKIPNKVMGPGMNTRYIIDKLNGENYLVGATQVQLILEAKRIWGHVDGTTKIEDTATNEQRKAHDKESRQAMAEIILNIEPHHAVAVISKKSPKGVWDTLRQMNQSRAVATQRTLRRKLLSLSKHDSQTVQEYANSIISIENELAASGHQISDFDIICALLEGLSESYDTIRTILREKEGLNFPQLVAKLEMREEELKYSKASSKNPNGETVPKAFISGKKGHFVKLRCDLCKKKGHKKKDCFFNPESRRYKPHLKKPRHLEEKESENGSSSQVHIAFMTNCSVQKPPETDEDISTKWFMDSCATQHMCKQLSYFKTISKCESTRGIDTAGIDSELESNYIGTIEILCTIDKRETLVTLKNVAYVPTCQQYAPTLFLFLECKRLDWKLRSLPVQTKCLFLMKIQQL